MIGPECGHAFCCNTSSPLEPSSPPPFTEHCMASSIASKTSGSHAVSDVSAKVEKAPESILVIDIGGSKVKALVTGQTEARKKQSGPHLTPGRLVEIVNELAEGWEYEALSIGYPGLVGLS